MGRLQTQQTGRTAGYETLYTSEPEEPMVAYKQGEGHAANGGGPVAAAGIRSMEEAKANGARTVYDEIEDLTIRPDLASALANNERAGAFFEDFPDSSKKNTLW